MGLTRNVSEDGSTRCMAVSCSADRTCWANCLVSGESMLIRNSKECTVFSFQMQFCLKDYKVYSVYSAYVQLSFNKSLLLKSATELSLPYQQHDNRPLKYAKPEASWYSSQWSVALPPYQDTTGTEVDIFGFRSYGNRNVCQICRVYAVEVEQTA